MKPANDTLTFAAFAAPAAPASAAKPSVVDDKLRLGLLVAPIRPW